VARTILTRHKSDTIILTYVILHWNICGHKFVKIYEYINTRIRNPSISLLSISACNWFLQQTVQLNRLHYLVSDVDFSEAAFHAHFFQLPLESFKFQLKTSLLHCNTHEGITEIQIVPLTIGQTHCSTNSRADKQGLLDTTALSTKPTQFTHYVCSHAHRSALCRPQKVDHPNGS
jgi:hypothetical protein